MDYPEKMNLLLLSKLLVSKGYAIEKIKLGMGPPLENTLLKMGITKKAMVTLRRDIGKELGVSEATVPISYVCGYLCIFLHFMDKHCSDKKRFWSVFDAINNGFWWLGMPSSSQPATMKRESRTTERGQISFRRGINKPWPYDREKEKEEVLFNKEDVPEWLERMDRMKIHYAAKGNIEVLKKHDWAAVCDRLWRKYLDGR